MKHTDLSKPCGKYPLLIASLIALVCGGIGSLYAYRQIDSLFICVFVVLAAVLLLVYIIRDYEQNRKGGLIGAAFALVGAAYLVSVFYNLISFLLSYRSKELYILPFLEALAAAVLWFAVTILFLKRRNCKPCLFVSVAVSVLIEGLSSSFSGSRFVLIGKLVLYATIVMLFVFRPKDPSLGKGIASSADIANLLAVLKEKRDLGIITEEEYRKARADMIAKL